MDSTWESFMEEVKFLFFNNFLCRIEFAIDFCLTFNIPDTWDGDSIIRRGKLITHIRKLAENKKDPILKLPELLHILVTSEKIDFINPMVFQELKFFLEAWYFDTRDCTQNSCFQAQSCDCRKFEKFCRKGRIDFDLIREQENPAHSAFLSYFINFFTAMYNILEYLDEKLPPYRDIIHDNLSLIQEFFMDKKINFYIEFDEASSTLIFSTKNEDRFGVENFKYYFPSEF